MSNKSKNSWNKGIFLALVKLYHFIALVQFVYAIYYDFVHVNVPVGVLKTKRSAFEGNKFLEKMKYLTFIDAVNNFITRRQSALITYRELSLENKHYIK
jgi:hypothetical protein